MNTHEPPVRLTERQRTLYEMVAAGYGLDEISDELEESFDVICYDWETAVSALGASTDMHAIALAIRGGHIL